jgi:ubiquinone/menaquinone biosynthesis C-methylase UbiE
MKTPLIKNKKHIERWWAENPMTYGSVHGTTLYRDADGSQLAVEFSTPEFYDEVDRTFYSWNRPLHDESGFFGKIFPYELYRGKKVLEIGCGMGTMAMNWARHGAHICAMDLNPNAVAQTAARFRLFGLDAQILEADSNAIPFRDSSFDYVYSWGVLHHSPDLDISIDELFRVLRSGGRFGVMLYNRHSILYWYSIQYTEGFLHHESQFLTPLQLASRYTDGDRREGNPHTWPVTKSEMRELFLRYSAELQIKVLGIELDNLLSQILPIPGLARLIPAYTKKPWARRWGWSLWICGSKK